MITGMVKLTLIFQFLTYLEPVAPSCLEHQVTIDPGSKYIRRELEVKGPRYNPRHESPDFDPMVGNTISSWQSKNPSNVHEVMGPRTAQRPEKSTAVTVG